MKNLFIKYKLLFIIIFLASLLRLWGLNSVPASLFGDELDVGYQAYSILKTGKDYTGHFMPFNLRSFAEWRTPIYIYSSVPTVAVFGISPLGVRLPAVIFGILSIAVIYFLTIRLTGKKAIGLLAALLLAISPWHLQYSRAGFEVTEMLFFYMLGVYFFLKGLSSPNLLVISAICLGIIPAIYSTAKLFIPLSIIALIVIWKDVLIKLPLNKILLAVLTLVIITLVYTYNLIFGGGTERIQEISIFNDTTIESQIGSDRVNDILVSGDNKHSDNIFDKLFHNKFTVFSNVLINNYIQSFSTEFLFLKGDYLNLRQSSGIEFYKIEFILILIGLIFMINSDIGKKNKLFLIFWLLAAPIPSSFTQGGGIHATRLILILPVLIILIAFALYCCYLKIVNKYFRKLFVFIILLIYLINFLFYQHNYWMHYPWESERWWHAGYEDAIKTITKESNGYDKVIISSADEPSLKFFLAWSMYPPEIFQKEYLTHLSDEASNNSTLHLGKFEFPPIGHGYNLYDLGSNLNKNTLYLATAKEIKLDLHNEPDRLPSDLTLIKIIKSPSGKPAFYIFRKK